MAKEINVKIENLKKIPEDYQKICNSLQSANQSIQNVSGMMQKYSYSNVRRALSNAVQNNETYTGMIGQLENTLVSIIQQYEKTENEILSKTITNKKYSDLSSNGSGITDVDSTNNKKKKEGSIAYAEGKSSISGIFGEAYAQGAISILEWKYGAEKLRAFAEASWAGAKGKAAAEGKYGAVSVEGSLLEIMGEASFGIPDSFSISEDEAKTAGLAVAISAAVLHGKAEGRVGLENMNVHGTAEGSVLGAGASAELGVVAGDGTIGLKAGVDAEAYLAKGEVSGGFTIFGIDIDIGAEGMIGVQAEASAEVGITGFGFDLGLGPIGLDVAIDWSDFDLTFWD